MFQAMQTLQAKAFSNTSSLTNLQLLLTCVFCGAL